MEFSFLPQTEPHCVNMNLLLWYLYFFQALPVETTQKDFQQLIKSFPDLFGKVEDLGLNINHYNFVKKREVSVTKVTSDPQLLWREWTLHKLRGDLLLSLWLACFMTYQTLKRIFMRLKSSLLFICVVLPDGTTSNTQHWKTHQPKQFWLIHIWICM